jgi:hypothetical protein
MEFDSSKVRDVDALGRELAAAMGDRFKPTRSITTEGRDCPGHCFVIVEFDSYEEAMETPTIP